MELRSEGKAGKKFRAGTYLQNFKNEEISEVWDETELRTGWAVTISGENQNNKEKLPSLNQTQCLGKKTKERDCRSTITRQLQD